MADYDPFVSDVAPAASTRKVRRLVTGLDAEGRSTIVLDDTGRHAAAGHGVPTYVATQLWRTESTPADNTGAVRDPYDTDERLSVGPPAAGSIFRTLELPPDRDWRFDEQGEEVRPLAFHTTRSIDYAIVLSGEVWAVLDATEVRMTAGDVLVQRGTSHAWSNRSDEPCLLAFVLIGGNLPEGG
ncbi:cupin domain-containing protein [uncultured Modestobacter sp.]|uniref:cupin domain-containing protein n=1 Tax=uncultured Modestobacter sp. TaxID=380048 RepID=UPI0026117A27|nr:cupin domain-containing protein [uncultured Modestobacter sp.]